jgi:hypothetical protein
MPVYWRITGGMQRVGMNPLPKSKIIILFVFLSVKASVSKVFNVVNYYFQLFQN